MLTNYPQSIATRRPVAGDTNDDGLGGRMWDWLRQTMCGLHGHDTLLQFEHDRMYLRCVSCGHETHGWELDAERPAVRLRAEGPRNALQRAPLVSERKIA
jgi:hypothetical protein